MTDFIRNRWQALQEAGKSYISRFTNRVYPETYLEEINEQCRLFFAPYSPILFVVWLGYLRLDAILFPNEPWILVFRIGLTVITIVAWIIRYFWKNPQRHYLLVTMLIYYLIISTGIITGLAKGAPNYVGGYCFVIVVISAIPIRLVHLHLGLGISLIAFILLCWNAGVSLSDPIFLYSVQDLIGAVVVNIFFSIGWFIVRRNSFQKGRTLQEMNIQMSRQQHILGEQNLALVQSEQFRLNMLSIVSHDLKAPISNVLGLSSVLLDNPALEEPTRLIVEHLQEAGSRMNRLVGDILDTAAREMGKIELVRQPTDIVDVMTTAVAHYTQAAKEKNQLFILDMPSELFAFADEQRLVQVFDNLISNAVKYSPFGGRIWVRCWQTADAVRVSVKDEGAGLSIADQQKLFGFFQRLSTEPTGGESSSGVGLSIVKQIVELHGGRVWCESEFGRGSTFIVELPQIH